MEENKKDNELPGKVSWCVVDAWLAIPPCTYTDPYCHVQCPYFYECNPPEDELDEDWEDELEIDD